MDGLIAVARWIANNVFREPASLIGLIALIGLLLQKKSASDVVTGTIKTILGFMIIQGGSTLIANSLGAFGPIWQEVFGMAGSAEVGGMSTNSFLGEYGGAVTLIMTFGFLVNVLLARITKFKYIYLTGHMMFWVSFVYAGIVVQVFGQGVSQMWMIISGAILLGAYWTLQPAYLQKYVKSFTGKDNFAVGHTFSTGAWLGAILGKHFGNKENDTEDLKMPEGFGFLKDSNVVIVLVMGLMYGLGALLAGPEFVGEYSGNKNHIVFGILKGFRFGAGIAVVLHGVKLLIGEIVPAFRGISQKLVPNSKPALDVPVTYAYAPAATIIGFAASFVTMVIIMVIMGATGFYVFVPPMIGVFFHAAGAGVFGNETGGVKGAIIAGVVVGAIITFGQAIFIKYIIPDTVTEFILWGGDTDMFVFGSILKWIMSLFA